MNEISRKSVQTATEMASARQHQKKNWPTIMKRACAVVEGKEVKKVRSDRSKTPHGLVLP